VGLWVLSRRASRRAAAERLELEPGQLEAA
jgi:hypothetical protein